MMVVSRDSDGNCTPRIEVEDELKMSNPPSMGAVVARNPTCLLIFVGLALIVLSGLGGQAPGNQHSTDWPAYGGGPENTHYSPLAQINRENVSRLRVAWSFDTEDSYPASEMECNPIIVAGVLYATSPKSNVVALNAATGKLLWRFDPNAGQKIVGKMRNRGVAYWADGKDRRIFAAARTFLYALDADGGRPVATFGSQGRIDLRDDLGRESKSAVTMTSPAIVYKDLVIIGSAMGETLPAAPGDIRAYDAHTGKLRWSFHTIPHPGESGYETWPKDAWKYSGAANNWAGMSLDVKRGLVFVPTGSAAYDFYGANRAGDNLFASSLLALSAETGERVWHFQTVHHDIWDRDLPAPPALVTVRRDDHDVDAVAQTTKSGYVFLFDRVTGTPLFPIEERRFPRSDLEGEVTAPTQPLPLKPPPFARQELTAQMLTERTPEAHQAAFERFKTVRSAGQFIPASREGTIIFPGFDGGAEWGGPAFDPESGLLYVNANEMAWILRMVEQKLGTDQPTGRSVYRKECATCHGLDMKGSPPEFPSLEGIAQRYEDTDLLLFLAQGSGRMPSFNRLGTEGLRAVIDFVAHGHDSPVKRQGASPFDMKYLSDGYNRFLDSDGYPAIQPPWGTLNAIDLNRGQIAWKIPLGEYPELASQGIAVTGSENYGGPVVTAGGLIFIAATSFDKKFRAFDKTTGKLLWETTLPAAGNATPSTYEVDGRQYVVIAAGGGKSKAPSGGSIVAFALPQ
jgi:quinoprotein glucose dehydrogenase